MRKIAIVENLPEKSRADGLAGVHWHGGYPAIGMTQPVVAALNPNDRETGFFESADQLFASSSFSTGHQATRTCWTATSVRRGGRGPSARQSVIASATRFISASRDLACV